METREQWLNAVAARFAPEFKKLRSPLPPFRVSLGFTSAGMRSVAIGECWTDTAVADGYHEIYIVPTIDDSSRIADILAHELCHVAAGIAAGHGAKFKRLALGLGLEGKMTATRGGEQFKKLFAPILTELGPIPHGRITGGGVSTGPGGPRTKMPKPGGGGGILRSGPKKQGTRLLKAECPDCGYTVRVTRKWLSIAIPKCPIHNCDME